MVQDCRTKRNSQDFRKGIARAKPLMHLRGDACSTIRVSIDQELFTRTISETGYRRQRTGLPLRSLLSLTTVKVSAKLGVDTTQMKVTNNLKTLVVVNVKLLFNTIKSYNSCFSVCPDLIIFI